jgi:hypothetical protein
MAGMRGRKVRCEVLLPVELAAWVDSRAVRGVSRTDVIARCIEAARTAEEEATASDLMLVELRRQGELLQETRDGVERLRAFNDTTLFLSFADPAQRPRSYEAWIDAMERRMAEDD